MSSLTPCHADANSRAQCLIQNASAFRQRMHERLIVGLRPGKALPVSLHLVVAASKPAGTPVLNHAMISIFNPGLDLAPCPPKHVQAVAYFGIAVGSHRLPDTDDVTPFVSMLPDGHCQCIANHFDVHIAAWGLHLHC